MEDLHQHYPPNLCSLKIHSKSGKIKGNSEEEKKSSSLMSKEVHIFPQQFILL